MFQDISRYVRTSDGLGAFDADTRKNLVGNILATDIVPNLSPYVIVHFAKPDLGAPPATYPANSTQLLGPPRRSLATLEKEIEEGLWHEEGTDRNLFPSRVRQRD
jgi:hypothetical protein